VKALTIILIFTTLFKFSLKSQTYFNKDYESDTAAWLVGTSIIPLQDTSGYVAVGINPKGGGPSYISFLRIDIYGDTLFTTTIGKYNYNETPSIGSLISIGDTNFVFTGYILADSLTPNQDSSFIKLYKVNDDGSLIWDKTYGDNGRKNFSSDVKPTSDGGFIITGWTTGWAWGNTPKSFLLKVDSIGNEQWHKIYGGTGPRYSYSVELTPDNGFIMAGGLNTGANSIDINWVKTDSLGNIIWDKTIGTPQEDNQYAYVTKYLNTGDFIITGSLEINPTTAIDLQSYIARIDGLTGNIVWSDTLGIEAVNVNEIYNSNVTVKANGDILAIGGVTDGTNQGLDAWLVKYSGNGDFVWERTFDKYGGVNQHYFWDIHSTFDGGFIICGDLTDVANSVQKLWVLKLDSMGCEVANCSVGIDETFSTEELSSVLIYPNPTNGILNISTRFKFSQLTIYSLSGQLIKTETNKQQINVADLPKGMYFLKLIGSKEVITQRFIKE
jgi:hypothetical protein